LYHIQVIFDLKPRGKEGTKVRTRTRRRQQICKDFTKWRKNMGRSRRGFVGRRMGFVA
jgi:hypothetical protein